MSPSLTSCRSCRSAGLQLILSLGQTPLANSLLTEAQLDEREPTYPLDLVFCPSCTLVQITETVAPEQLFGEYLYFSSFSDTLLRHADTLVRQVIDARKLTARSRVVEIASNDGYLLQYYRQRGIPVLGIDPAANVARVAIERGIPTLIEFFSLDLAQRLRDRGEAADVIHVNNVLAHVPELNGFVKGIQVLLKDDGVAVIEVPYLKDLIDNCEFDTIYHEHLCYYSVTALDHLFQHNGLFIHDVERIPIHGGSLRVAVGKSPHPALPRQRGRESFLESPRHGGRESFPEPPPQGGRESFPEPPPHGGRGNVPHLLGQEAAWGVDELATYKEFGARVEALKASLTAMLAGFKRRGDRIAAYGAAAKGSTLLNYFGIGRETLDFVVDRSPHKQGRFMPGVHIPIRAPERLLEEMPDEVLLLTWNFADEILEQQKIYRQLGGRFIIPLPEVRVVEAEELAA